MEFDFNYSCMNHGFVQKIIEERHYVYLHRQTPNVKSLKPQLYSHDFGLDPD